MRNIQFCAQDFIVFYIIVFLSKRRIYVLKFVRFVLEFSDEPVILDLR